MFDEWRTFYQTTAGAAATLTGLVFVVVTLAAARETTGRSSGQGLFVTPTVFHLTSVLVVSALALAPEGAVSLGLMSAWAAFGIGHAAWVARRVAGLSSHAHWSDIGWYGLAPAAAFTALGLACALAWANVSHAAYVMALSLLALLIVAIRNAWDLATWLATRRDPPG